MDKTYQQVLEAHGYRDKGGRIYEKRISLNYHIADLFEVTGYIHMVCRNRDNQLRSYDTGRQKVTPDELDFLIRLLAK